MPRANIIVTHHHRIVSSSLNHKTYYLIRCRSSSVWIVMTASFSFFLRWILPWLAHRYFQCKSFLFWLAWASKCFLRLVRFSLIKVYQYEGHRIQQISVFSWIVYVVPGFSSYESDNNTRTLFVLISFRFSSESVYNINSIFGNSCVNFFENLQHLVFHFSIGFIVWRWYTMYFQVLSSVILF